MIQNTMLPLQMITPTTSSAAAPSTNKAATPAEVTKSFGSFLSDALQQVDTQEQQVHAMNDQFILGEVDVDQLMIASERALLSLQLTTQVRNKVIEAYQDIMRMQM
ncbi:flagellar hook-basal body complex protein FliE [Paenibacillus apiarius]|uniref:Flagellar hook-basal body complex protein FliE n=1 Tax=Paenibacillus apiarius TaxID=46240 RepID=A0ABT4DLX6_9BACL|nr:flagellar hook-basal body complex protein FliE [Paenibacillus apiarius]MBN3526187.1 flagellar hook-basal body complex protein FliE [Paenibacillus apiarius]MCY9516179.1 flagellar hook-basal body complex protein FliE [Paenibacillus apiarius]MCY9518362.1 flagellar hook-basal body complex protein FliE [Paenibacillus apiarius]MCY9551237.1 flagellar hook-basal body complex protein FliE [Paenibacillus apiarius]MCY9558391.1 flagellar hook-basal body complex protein FliE [Paenibacillus apiarius]